MKKIAIFASGSGTNAENIIRTFSGGNRIEVTCVVCNVREAGVMARAAALHIPTIYISNEELRDEPQALIYELMRQGVDLIVLAGFMRKIPEAMVQAFPDRIINIHPSLLPKYGGKGMWGHHVHEAVIAAGEVESGVTVHYVNNVMDGGRILMQQRVQVTPTDTPQSLESKIHAVEYELYPRAIVAALEGTQQPPAVPATSQVPEIPTIVEPEDLYDAEQEAESTEFEEQMESEVTPDNVPQGTPESAPVPPAAPSNDNMWADALHINFTPPAQPQPMQPMQPMQNAECRMQNVQPAQQQGRVLVKGRMVINEQTGEPEVRPMPKTYMVWSVIMTLLCCIPVGIIAIIYSAKVRSKYYAGKFEEAEKASETAQLWIILSFVIGIIWYAVYWFVLMPLALVLAM